MPRTRSSKQVHRRNNQHPQSDRAEPRLILPPVTDPKLTAAAVDQLIGTWVIPRLAEEYVRDKGMSPRAQYVSREASIKRP